MKDLAVNVPFIFRKPGTRFRLGTEGLYAIHESCGESLPSDNRVATDLRNQFLYIIQCIGSPDYFSHCLNLCFAASCEMPSPHQLLLRLFQLVKRVQVLNQLVDIHVFREIGHSVFNLLLVHLTPFSKVDRELSLGSPIRRNRPVASYQ